MAQRKRRFSLISLRNAELLCVPNKSIMTTSASKHPALSWLIPMWTWALRLVAYTAVFWLFTRWPRFYIQMRLAPASSLLHHYGWLLLAFVAVMLGVTAVHELGHLLAGRLAGLRFHLLIIGPLQVRQATAGWQLRWQRGLGFFNGMAASLPTSRQRLRQRMMLFAAGGPLASLTLTLLALLAAYLWRQRPSLYQHAAWVWDVAGLTAVVSAIFFFTTFRPGRYPNGLMTDGGRLAMLLQGGAAAARYCALLLINAAEVQGKRPSQWDRELIAQALQPSDQSDDAVMARLLAYQQALDKTDLALAAPLLEAALANRFAWVGGMQVRLLLEKAFLLAHHEEDAIAATNLLAKLRHVPPSLALTHHRVKTAVLLATKDNAAAYQTAQAGLALGQQQIERGGVWQAEMDWLARLAAAAQAVA